MNSTVDNSFYYRTHALAFQSDSVSSVQPIFFFLHCPLFCDGCGGSSSRLSRHTSRQGMVWNGRRFFHIPYWQFSSIPFPFYTKNLPFHTKIFFHIHSILPYQRNFRLEAMQRVFCCFAPLQCCKQPLVKVRQQY